MSGVRIVYGALTGDRGGFSRPAPRARMVYGTLTGGSSAPVSDTPRVKIVYGALTGSAQDTARQLRLSIREVDSQEIQAIAKELKTSPKAISGFKTTVAKQLEKNSQNVSPKAANVIQKAVKNVLKRVGEACLRLSK